ncbi:tetratricopeptide repeat protein [Thermodesulfobacteriota bacterium]
MPKKRNAESEYVKKDTMLMVAFIALVVGFFGGVVFSVFKHTSGVPMQTPAPVQQAVQSPESADEQRTRIASLELKTSLNPESAEAWIQLGNLYFDANSYPKAIDAYKKSLELNPNNANVMTDLGVMYRRNGQPREAVKAFDKAIEIDPRHETSRFNKGVVLMHDLNDFGGAITAWEGLVEVNPSALSPTGQPVKDLVEQLKASAKK